MPFHAQDRFIVREDLLEERVDDELVVLDLSADAYFGTNAVGRAVWECLPERCFDEIVEHLLGLYEVERSVLVRDVEAFLEEAVRSGVVTVEPSDGGS